MREAASGPWGVEYRKLRAKLGTDFLIPLLGSRGVGKTQMAACLALDAVERELSVRYVKAAGLFREIRASFGRELLGRDDPARWRSEEDVLAA